MKKLFIILSIISIITLMGCSTSDGVRTGKVIKLSKKGIISKTSEGEMMLGDGNASKSWLFSIEKSNEKIYQDVQTALEKECVVKLYYNQVAWVWPWEADTDYFIKKVVFSDTTVKTVD